MFLSLAYPLRARPNSLRPRSEMRSTPLHTSAYAARAILLLALSTTTTTVYADALTSMTYVGCFSSSQPLSDEGSYTYQTSGYCQPICVGQNQAVLGLTGGSDCWCGDLLPPTSSQVDDSNCNTPCNGYNQEMCTYTIIKLSSGSSERWNELTRDHRRWRQLLDRLPDRDRR